MLFATASSTHVEACRAHPVDLLQRHRLRYPGRHALARGCSITDRAVDRAVRRIERAGFLTVERSDGGRNRTNHYVATLPETANPVRRSEWRNSEPRDAKQRTARHKTANAVRPKASESDESSGSDRLSGAATAVEETCLECDERFVGAPDDVYCRNCQHAKAAA
jgi:hypothetical protein